MPVGDRRTEAESAKQETLRRRTGVDRDAGIRVGLRFAVFLV